jgi:hypothetical protein
MTVEEAESAGRVIASATIRLFLSEHGRFPALAEAHDWREIGKILDFDTEARTHPGLSGYDITYAVLRQWLQGAQLRGTPARDDRLWSLLLDAIMGRVYYNPPSREIEFRMAALKELQKEWPLPELQIAVDGLLQTLTQVDFAANQTLAADVDLRHNMRDSASNPLTSLCGRLRKHYVSRGRDIAGLQNRYALALESRQADPLAHYS